MAPIGASCGIPSGRRMLGEAEVELHDVVGDGRQGSRPRSSSWPVEPAPRRNGLLGIGMFLSRLQVTQQTLITNTFPVGWETMGPQNATIFIVDLTAVTLGFG